MRIKIFWLIWKKWVIIFVLVGFLCYMRLRNNFVVCKFLILFFVFVLNIYFMLKVWRIFVRWVDVVCVVDVYGSFN